MPRKTITDMIPDIDAPAEVPQLPPPAPVPSPEPVTAGERQDGEPGAQRPPRGGRPRPAKAGRPSARDLAAPAKQNIAREALKVDVPVELALVQRLHRRRLDTGMDLRDQVAIAVDEWLTADGY